MDMPQYRPSLCVAEAGRTPSMPCRRAQRWRASEFSRFGRDFIDDDNVAQILGDNIFFGHGLPQLMVDAIERARGATIFAYHVSDPERYGVVELDADGNPIAIEEKPKAPGLPGWT